MKSVVVLSGGMDSTVALAQTVAKYTANNVETITFNYGSKHNDRENLSAIKVSDHYGVKNTIVRLPFINELFKSDLLKSGGDVPDGHYADPTMKRTVVPFRNGIMLSIAAGYAESVDADTVVLGNHVGDHAVYPDCREEFNNPMSQAIEQGTYKKVKLVNPFGKVDKTEICRIGSTLKVPFELTWSCYKGGDVHCGKCGTCVERIEAFNLTGVQDPTVYG